YRCDGLLAGEQDSHGALDPEPAQISHWGFAGAETELPGEVESADAGLVGKLVQRDPLIEVVGDVDADPAQVVVGQPDSTRFGTADISFSCQLSSFGVESLEAALRHL